jgi:beta-galactosidase
MIPPNRELFLPMPTRRHFLKSAAATAALAHPLSASIVRPFLQAAAKSNDDTSVKLLDAWDHYRDSLAGPWEAWHGDEIAAWEKVTLPHCFNHYDACDPDTPYYRGQGWYRTEIPNTLPANNGRVLLHFEGAGQTTTVWINNQLIGTHVGGYDEFVYDITDALKAAPIAGAIKQSPNTVALTVLTDNSRDLERSPSDLSDFSLYGGLYRRVHLVTVPAVSIESAKITPILSVNNPNVRVEIKLYNPMKVTGRLDITCNWHGLPEFSKSGVTEHHGMIDGDTYQLAFNIAEPQLWSPESPYLYVAWLHVSTESGTCPNVSERFGLKHTEWVDHGPFKLNGERLLLNGTQRHMDHAGFAAAQPEELIREEFGLMKKMGVNLVRLAHYQQTKFVLDLCDELGILVWEESTWCREGIGDAQWQTQTKQAFTNLIHQHYNHPSILIWGLGNEDDWPNEYPSVDKAAIRKFMQEMHDLAHSLDPTRVAGFRRCDFAADIPDVYSPSIWAGWYSGLYTEYQKSLETWRPKVKHLIHIEWGADSHARRHAEDPYAHIPHIATGQGTAETGLAYRDTGGPPRISRDGDWSETYACDLFDWYLKTQEPLDWFTGSAQWIFKDFTTPLRAENPVPRINQKGVLERDLTQKESYFVFQSYWTDEKSAPMVRVYGHTWPVRWGAAGEKRTVRVYSNCPTAELFLNGKSLGVKKRNSQDFPCAGLRWETPFATGKNHLRVVATSSTGKAVSDEINFSYQTAAWSKPTLLKLAQLSLAATTNTVEATLHDAAGNLCLDSRIAVRFSLAGPGILHDNLGTSSGSRLVQLYNGRAQITYTHANGPNTIAVTAEGITSASITLS